MAKLRMPLTNLKRKLPSIFLGVCITLMTLFILNVFHGMYNKDPISEMDANVVDSRRLAQWGVHRKGRRRMHLLDNDDEDLVCKMPKLNIKTDANKHAFYKMPPLNCTGESLLYMHNNRLFINETVLRGRKIKKCEYRGIKWQSDDYAMTIDEIVRQEEPFVINMKYDFFQVECSLLHSHRAKRETEFNANFYMRKLLRNLNSNGSSVSKTVNKEDIHHPRNVGSIGLPDPVFINGDPFELKTKDAKNDIKEENSQEAKHDKINKGGNDKQMENYNKEVDKPVNDFLDDDPFLYGTDFEHFFTQVLRKEEVIERIKETKPKKNSLQMNVLIIALDSMSHLSYQRKMPKTYSYLKKTLGSVILNGYNIVGDATTAALLPIFTGKFETELPEVRRGRVDSTFVDAFPFVWNKFEQSGYVTFYAEDQPTLGTFQLRFNGFEEEPVDHYLRPFWQAALDSKLHQHQSNHFCLGNRAEHTYQLNYVDQFFKTYYDVPKFGFAFFGELPHADNNPAEYMDGDLVELLTSLSNSKALNNTLLVVMGDHGARYSKVRRTVQGKLEERLPFMSLTFPGWFKEKYRNYYQNLKKNAERLTTPFDIHETFKDLLDINRAELPVKYYDRGVSLLHEIPSNRTCKSAHIDVHWCTCMKYEEVDIGHQYVVHGAKLMVDQINSVIANHQDQCERLRLHEINDAKMIIPNEKVLKFLKNIDSDQRVANFSKNIEFDIVSYQIIIETTPNMGLYEGTVQYTIKKDEWLIYPEISRINAYGDQSSCIIKTLPELRKYCYCRNQAKKS